MKKLVTVASMPIVAAIMLMQGIDLPPDAPLEEAEEVIRLLQDSVKSVDGISEVENR